MVVSIVIVIIDGLGAIIFSVTLIVISQLKAAFFSASFAVMTLWCLEIALAGPELVTDIKIILRFEIHETKKPR